jgi:hypothetical protein
MRRVLILASLFLLSFGLSTALAQESAPPHSPTANASHKSRKHQATLNTEDRSEVIRVALESKAPRRAERDCSHLVHSIYERAGFPYTYADSDDLYDGTEGFQRVSKPQSADLVVWHGHVGIVTQPSHHSFFSFLSRGPGIDDYQSRYWRSRGKPRFYRYVKNHACDGCVLATRRTR